MNHPKSPAGLTAAAALVVALVGGATGGLVALSGGSEPAPQSPAEVRVDTVADELAVSPNPSPIIEEEAPVTTPKPSASSPTTAVPVATPAPDTATRAEQSADRAKKEADRAEDAANRAEDAAAKATPVPSPAPKPEQPPATPAPSKPAPMAAGNPCETEGMKGWIGPRNNPRQTFECRNGVWVETTPNAKPSPSPAPVEPGAPAS